MTTPRGAEAARARLPRGAAFCYPQAMRLRGFLLALSFLAATPSARAEDPVVIKPVREESPANAERSSYRPAAPGRPSVFSTPMNLRLEILDTTVRVGEPFRILLTVRDANGFPMVNFQERVTYEAASGVIPIISPRRWEHARLEDTIVIPKPGRNIRLTAMTGDVIASVQLDVLAKAPGAQFWLDKAAEAESEGNIGKAVEALHQATAVLGRPNSEIERRLARHYLNLGQWDRASHHYSLSLNAAITEQ